MKHFLPKIAAILLPLAAGVGGCWFGRRSGATEATPVPAAPVSAADNPNQKSDTALDRAMQSLPSELHRESATLAHLQTCSVAELISLAENPSKPWRITDAAVSLIATRLLAENPAALSRAISPDSPAWIFTLETAVRHWLPLKFRAAGFILTGPGGDLPEAQAVAYLQALHRGDFVQMAALLASENFSDHKAELAVEFLQCGGDFAQLAARNPGNLAKLKEVQELYESTMPGALWEFLRTADAATRLELIPMALKSASCEGKQSFRTLFSQLTPDEQRRFVRTTQPKGFLRELDDYDALMAVAGPDDSEASQEVRGWMTSEVRVAQAKRDMPLGSKEREATIGEACYWLDSVEVALRELTGETPATVAMGLRNWLPRAAPASEAILIQALSGLDDAALSTVIRSGCVPDWLWERQDQTMASLVGRLEPQEQEELAESRRADWGWDKPETREYLRQGLTQYGGDANLDSSADQENHLRSAFSTWSEGREEAALALLAECRVKDIDLYGDLFRRWMDNAPDLAAPAFQQTLSRLPPEEARELLGSCRFPCTMDLFPVSLLQTDADWGKMKSMQSIALGATDEEWQKFRSHLSPEQLALPTVQKILAERSKAEAIRQVVGD